MTEHYPPERRTVQQSDELLEKSRRLIDELELILVNPPGKQISVEGTSNRTSPADKDSARSD
jgi:hypothetical protein